MSSPSHAGPDPKALRTAYTFGIFSMALIDVFVFLIPVYAGITLGMKDWEIGTLVGARSFISFPSTIIFAASGGGPNQAIRRRAWK